MGYNISEVSGNFTGTEINGLDGWTATVDLSDPNVTVVTGDFDELDVEDGDQQEAEDGYVFSPLSTNAYGTLSADTEDGTFVFTIDRAAVIASGTDQTVTFTVTGSNEDESDTDDVIINILICVARGTRIATPGGETAVEDLAVGDLVLTRDGGPQPIRWIGARRVGAGELARDPSLRPVRILRGAFGAGRPARDLVVTPQHRILLSDWRAEIMFGEAEVLAPAKALVNERTIRIDREAGEVEYFHLLFDCHQIIYTEALPTESFHPGAYSLRELDRATRAEIIRLFPELGADANSYGSAARLALSVGEARLLAVGGPRAA
ncbi:MAG: Hint domain-containing protein [Paracoccaceae bacterium]